MGAGKAGGFGVLVAQNWGQQIHVYPPCTDKQELNEKYLKKKREIERDDLFSFTVLISMLKDRTKDKAER
jgi:hypothetical protein